MQIALPTTPAPQPATDQGAKGAQRAEFRFASDAALERALLLARDQSWIASCSVDRSRRMLQVVLSAGTREVRPPAVSGASALLH